jgi:hypothetical protein
MCTAVLIGWNPAIPPPPVFGLIYEGTIGQPRLTHLVYANAKTTGIRIRNQITKTITNEDVSKLTDVGNGEGKCVGGARRSALQYTLYTPQSKGVSP